MEVLIVVSYLSAFLTLIYLLVVAGFIRGWHKLIPFRYKQTTGTTSVSIIVAARNEADNIHRTIESLLAQDYNKALTEIIFIDDHSTDNTAEIVRSYAASGVKLISLKENQALNSYKKKAIQTAIGQATGDLIITTDADCRMGTAWLKTIIAFYEQNRYKMISSPVAYDEEKSFFERAQSLEFLYLIGLGASTIGNKKPSTCNGANLAYEKAAFYEVGGFQGIDDLASGDDELLLHKIAARYDNHIGFLRNPDAMVYTHAKPNLGEFLQQRKRWASKSTRYKNKSIIVLGVFIWFFNVSILLNLLVGLFFIGFLKIALIQLLLKIIVEFIFLMDVTKFAKRRSLMVLLPVLNVLHVLYIIYIGVAGNSGKYNWKGRMVK
ncbi:cellulose synthase/poly-beta-1,6-N-acetylglucosamine synthase-like glycosyltransferase [Pedobacter cryoconitis]|uniref:Cellulose synthase/poly-beta-1,6-N-acetylglucosamine synthase-like glycosyltransferase n=1 Tax=Pedobacter cryoconitis TaxID=188932 RepID=A0A7W9DIT6_9SPHI|nr:glycosyltransferase [Pedobacter cryoconitis]MBB5620019.1 cellulose synthase/poly-beta-1,6-N-acetylglucosamine synthase-like glycosyltransferase [Pedobacter cryoconitis]MBB5648165.1 cellulose synthase/poly-beta-1,6-N-acetylglucosamine synthase-like glycosyltransferase [Pedobacter cryoconitis]